MKQVYFSCNFNNDSKKLARKLCSLFVKLFNETIFESESHKCDIIFCSDAEYARYRELYPELIIISHSQFIESVKIL